ncbi:MAG TPA: FtsW/RodA/SpoVE family cell cycle protein, partial [Gemmatimonadaceae bacterium]|nr:FtsW/RodA/SpoVE family cell cycle protein [Gemmatimonadaceae bacterium]
MTAVGDVFSPSGTAGTPSRGARSVSRERVRWRMTLEARLLVVLTATILVFGLTTLYSASSIVAVQEGRESWFFLYRQLTGVAVGIVALAVLAKWDADRWRDYAWPLIGLAIFTMMLTVLPGFERFAPRINGSRRFLLGGSIQPSEFAKLAVVIWTAMLIVKKGGEEGLRKLTKGLMPFGIILSVLSLFAALQPDFSVILFYALVMGTMLFAAGARIGHFVFLGALALPIVWSEINRLEYIMRRLLGFAGAAGAEAQVNYQLEQSLIAVGS